ncbi:MAG: hypothetical protein A3H42_02300 [Deltaproteobacteria bacterium RIFCSPLOWO2_02_FULL_46_8]|nr:MAG: hypothetical protein A3H42_02300 [Deltaproteobacteria bacterium RIFCSPLOWO2_02_FULL_46_8]
MGRWVWPVVEDYNSDGRADLAVYDKEHGVWYIKFTNKNLLVGRWSSWDWQIQLPYHDELNRSVRLTKYARPLPGDYNSDGNIDLALARSDGIWSIDFGGPNRSDYGSFDQSVNYLTPAQLAAAPGWAYLAVADHGDLSFKVPDSVSGAGQWWGYSALYGGDWGTYGGVYDLYGRFVQPDPNFSLGGNDQIPLIGDWPTTKSSQGIWTTLEADGHLSQSDSIYGGLDCHPFMADYDGDGKQDRAVQCPNEFRIVQSSDNSVRHIPLAYNSSEFSMPGKIYVGGISYQTSQQIIDYQLQISNDPPVIPVDMVQGDFCNIPWEPTKIPQECQ